MKALFPRSSGALEAIVINTAGGLTGGDKVALAAEAESGASLSITTQAAERAYRAASGFATADSVLTAQSGAQINWLPQELILFEGAALRRSLRIELATDARLLMVEPVVFGRAAMGEVLRDVSFHDRIEIYRNGLPLYMDALRLDGDLVAQMARLAKGAGAMASLVFVAPQAETHLSAVRAMLPETGGASLLHPDLLALRLVAEDGFELRGALLPILDRLSGDTLPTSWRL